jgi:L-lactate permease
MIMKNLKNIKLTNTHKIIIGVAGLGILAFLTRKYWMPKKKQEEISKQSVEEKLKNQAVIYQKASTTTPKQSVYTQPNITETFTPIKK